MSADPTVFSLDSFESLLETCSTIEYSKSIFDELLKLIKEIPSLLKRLKTESKTLFTEKSYNSLQLIYEKDQPDVLYIMAQLFNKLLYPEHFDIICHDETTIIYLLYLILNTIEKNKGGILCHLLIRKAQVYMKHLFKQAKSNKLMLSELIKAFPVYHSLTFKKFNAELAKSKVIDLCNSIIFNDKEEGVNTLSMLISEKTFFAEQFELLYLSVPTVLASLLKAPKEDEISAYLKFANVLSQLLYSTTYKMSFPDNEEDNNKPIDPKTIYVLKDQKATDLSELKLLNEKLFELTYQKEILESNESIIEVCLLFISLVIHFDKNFQLQFMCYVLLRKIYFVFPMYHQDIGEYLPLVLTNLCKFQGQTEWNRSLECREFAFYLLTRDQHLKTKIKCSTAVPQKDIRFPTISLKDISFRVGFPLHLTLAPREIVEKKIEVSDTDSLVYICINEEEERDITVSLFKLNNETKSYNCIIDKEKVNESQKLLIKAIEPSLYFLRFDNSSSWFKERKLQYQIVYLKPSLIK